MRKFILAGALLSLTLSANVVQAVGVFNIATEVLEHASSSIARNIYPISHEESPIQVRIVTRAESSQNTTCTNAPAHEVRRLRSNVNLMVAMTELIATQRLLHIEEQIYQVLNSFRVVVNHAPQPVLPLSPRVPVEAREEVRGG